MRAKTVKKKRIDSRVTMDFKSMEVVANWEEKKEGSERHLGSDMHGYTTAHLF